MIALTLTFRDCGFAGRELAWLGEYLVGAVEAPGLCGIKAYWSFHPETRRKLLQQPAPSLDAARRLVENETNQMLLAMGVLLPGDGVRVVIITDPARACAQKLSRKAFARRTARTA
jgi:hypothetical protein